MNQVEKKQGMWNITFICTVIGQFLSTTSTNVTNPLVTSYAAFLGADAVTVGLLTGMIFGVANLLRPFAGPTIVRINKKRLLIFGFSLGITVNVMYAVFNTVPLFIAARFLQGAQFSIMGPLLMTIAGDSLPREKLASGIGIFTVSGIIATATGPSIGLAINSFVKARFGDLPGFQSIFFTSAAIQLIALLPSSLMRPRVVTKEQIASAGVWYKNIFAPAAIPPSLCLTFNFISFSLYNAYLVPYAAEKGFTGIALFFTIYAAGTLVLRPLVGKITDRFGASYVVYPSLIFFIASFLVLWRAQSMGFVYLSAALSAIGFGSTFPVFQALSMQAVPVIKRGVASTTSFFGIDLGQFFGPLIGGAIIARFAATGHAYSTLYLFAPASVLVTAVLYTASKKFISRKINEVNQLAE